MLPDVNVGVVLAVAAPTLTIIAYFVKTVVEANRDLRSTVADLTHKVEDREARIAALKELASNTALMESFRTDLQRQTDRILEQVATRRRSSGRVKTRH